jgi:hypothetical protein
MIVLAGGACYRLACVHFAAPGAVSRVGPGRRDQLLRTAIDGLGMCCCYCIPRFGSDGILEVSSLPACSPSDEGGLRGRVR